MVTAIQATGRSAPGPDGIPYAAWRHLGQLGIDCLYEEAQVLTSGDMDNLLCQMDPAGGAHSHTFNQGNMVFLPKKVSGTHPLFGDYYFPGDVRPLVIVNTDNRIIANWFRCRWEPFFDSWISEHQQGFLPGRSMASNIVSIEHAAQKVSLSHPRGVFCCLIFKRLSPALARNFSMICCIS